MSRLAYQSNQPLLELCSCCPGKCEHKQLFVLHVQDPCLTTARPSRYHNATRHLVWYDLLLSLRKLCKELLVFLRRDVPLNLPSPFTFEIFGDEAFVVHLKIILYIQLGGLIAAYHQIGVFTYYVNLLDLLFVELVKHTIIILLITQFHIFQPMDSHCIIEYHEASIQLECTNIWQVKKCLFHIFYLNLLKWGEKRPPIWLELVQQVNNGELHHSAIGFRRGNRRTRTCWQEAVQPF